MERKSLDEIKKEAKKAFGFTPGFVDEWAFENPAGDIIWELVKHYDTEETHIPAKYKHLLCYAVAAVIHCPYCTPYHKALAEMNGATEIELQEAALPSSTWTETSTVSGARIEDIIVLSSLPKSTLDMEGQAVSVVL